MTRRLVVSLHDVSPRHEEAIEAILAFLAGIGVPPVPLLVVPDFHGEWPLDRHPGFVAKLLAWREAGHELALHGYFHREDPADARLGRSLRERFQRAFLTGGEGEFLSLSPTRLRERLDRGLELWDRAGLGTAPRGFVPPAWLHNAELDEALWERGFAWTEDHAGVRSPAGELPCPVVSWASRDPVRRFGSTRVCPRLERGARGRQALRLALHPHDWDWPTLRTSIAAVLEAAGRHGQWSDMAPLLDRIRQAKAA